MFRFYTKTHCGLKKNYLIFKDFYLNLFALKVLVQTVLVLNLVCFCCIFTFIYLVTDFVWYIAFGKTILTKSNIHKVSDTDVFFYYMFTTTF